VFNDFGQHMRTLCQNMVKKLARQQKKTNFNYEKKIEKLINFIFL